MSGGEDPWQGGRAHVKMGEIEKTAGARAQRRWAQVDPEPKWRAVPGQEEGHTGKVLVFVVGWETEVTFVFLQISRI